MRKLTGACRSVLLLTLCTYLRAQFGGAIQTSMQPTVQQLPLDRTAPGTGTANPGSIPGAPITRQPIALTLGAAVQRGLRYNLTTIAAGDAALAARAHRLASAAALRPDVTGYLQETVQQIDLAALGLRVSQPEFQFPTVVGPFNYFDLRAQLTESLSLTGLRNWRASRENLRSADLGER
jgi:hypothetical protein